jgi:hypothetical protein
MMSSFWGSIRQKVGNVNMLRTNLFAKMSGFDMPRCVLTIGLQHTIEEPRLLLVNQ